MKTYKVPRLTNKTPIADQNKLTSALRAVAGVEKATLDAAGSSFEIRAQNNHEPKRAEIVAAASDAGFPVS